VGPRRIKKGITVAGSADMVLATSMVGCVMVMLALIAEGDG
jgi:hypothetical protein